MYGQGRYKRKRVGRTRSEIPEGVKVLAQFKTHRSFMDTSKDIEIVLNANDPGATEFIRNFDQFEIFDVYFVKAHDVNDAIDLNDAIGIRNCNGEPLSDNEVKKYAEWKRKQREGHREALRFNMET